MKKIIGRRPEQAILQKLLEKNESTFLAIYGRRRIGKTYLIKNYFRDKAIFFHLTGIQEAHLSVQLQNFAVEFSDVFAKGKQIVQPKNWFAAFQLLRKEVEKIPKHMKMVIFFDELPWLASPRSKFLQALEHLWNRYLSELPNVILIVCGSAASWMIENVINNKGGLHGRVTKEIRLLPFSLKETEEFLHENQIFLDRKQILELYMCLGGVAKYLSYIERGKSVSQSIGELCFSYNAPLLSEFHKLYRSLFRQHEDHLTIVRTLATSRIGLSYQDLSIKAKMPSGGTLTAKLEELIQSGFVIQVPQFGEGEKSHLYLLIDEYSLFYLTWNTDASSLDIQGRGADYWMKQRNTQAWREWTGHAFECLCLKHIEGIKSALGLGAVLTSTSKWKYVPSPRQSSSGAAIDLVIDRADACINLCEIKFYSEEFIADKEYADKLRKKKECFERITETKKSTFTTLITTYGTKRNDVYLSAVDQDLTMDALFLL